MARASRTIPPPPESLPVTQAGDFPIVPVADLHPNAFNPNKVAPDIYAKLERNVLKTWKTKGTIPPVVYRTLESGRKEIIDGYHRWSIFKSNNILGIPAINMGSVSGADARSLCINLNYLKGEPDPKAYAATVQSIMEEQSWDIEELSNWIPESPGAIEDLLAVYGSDSPTFEWGEDESSGGGDTDTERFDSDPDPTLEFVIRVPIKVSIALESARAQLHDMLYDAENDPNPDTDAVMGRLTAALLQGNIKQREDIFNVLRKKR